MSDDKSVAQRLANFYMNEVRQREKKSEVKVPAEVIASIFVLLDTYKWNRNDIRSLLDTSFCIESKKK